MKIFPLFATFIRFWREKIGIVEANILKGVNEILSPYFLYSLSNFGIKVGTVEAYVLKHLNEILPHCFLLFSFRFKKIGRVGSYLLKGVN
jgi:hypothetical protein